MSWPLTEPARGVKVFAEADGVWFRGEGVDLSDPRQLKSLAPKTRLGRLSSRSSP